MSKQVDDEMRSVVRSPTTRGIKSARGNVVGFNIEYIPVAARTRPGTFYNETYYIELIPDWTPPLKRVM